MALTPLIIGTTANPIAVPTATDLAQLLPCGALDISLLNGVLKVLGDRVNAIDAADNAIMSATYNAATNNLTFTMSDGAAVIVPLGTLISDAVATGLITSSVYNSATNILTLTTAAGNVIPIDMTSVLSDAVAGALLPTGMIVMWSGVVAPSGWALCDGTAGTPDLRDRMVIGAGTTYTSAQTGGAVSHNHGGVTGPHVLTVAEMPAHVHGSGIVDDQPTLTFTARGFQAFAGGGNAVVGPGGGAPTGEALTESIGGGGGHDHSVSTVSNLPPYYALAFIMKL